MTELELYEELLSDLDQLDEAFIVIDYDVEKPEVKFRWEYAFEGLTNHDSPFKKIYPDN